MPLATGCGDAEGEYPEGWGPGSRLSNPSLRYLTPIPPPITAHMLAPRGHAYCRICAAGAACTKPIWMCQRHRRRGLKLPPLMP